MTRRMLDNGSEVALTMSSEKASAQNPFLPLPIPLVLPSGDIKWPLDTRGCALFFSGIFNSKNYCIEIFDVPGAHCLTRYGFFGRGNSCDSKYKLFHTSVITNSLLEPEPSVQSPASVLLKHEKQQSSLGNFIKSIAPKLASKQKLTADLYNRSPMTSFAAEDREESRPIFQTRMLSNENKEMAEAETNEESCLQLSLEEAFFLSYCLGILNVKTESGPCFNLNDLWNLFRRKSKDDLEFVVNYAAYHYFRTKGWIVKDGLKYGCKFLVYKEGPPFFHSLMSVTVVRVDKQGRHPNLSWQYINGLQRISEGAAKEPIICQVHIPSTVTANDFLKPDIIQKLTIQCIRIRRWNCDCK